MRLCAFVFPMLCGLALVACDPSDTCDDGELACDGDSIVSCKDGDWLALKDCTVDEQVCHELDEQVQCMPASAAGDSGRSGSEIPREAP